MASDEKEARSLVSYLLKHRYLLITSVAPGPKVAQLERAEKRFLAAFITNTVAAILIILSRLWGINTPAQILTLPFGDIVTIFLSAASLASLLLAWLAYFEIGISLSVERAVEIKPRDAS